MSAIVSLLRVMTLRDAEAITLEADRVPSLRRRGQVEALAMPAIEAALLEEFAAPLVEGKPLDQGPLMVAFTDDEGATYPVTIERTSKGIRIVARRPKPAAKSTAPAASPAGARPPQSPAAPAGSQSGSRVPAGAEPGARAAPAARSATPASQGRAAPPDATAYGHAVGANPHANHGAGAHDSHGASAHGASAYSHTAAHGASAHGASASTDRTTAYGDGEAYGAGASAHDHDLARADARARLARVLAMPVAMAVERGASDVFLSTAQPPRVRVDGRLETLDVAVDDAELAACLHALGGPGTSADLSLDLDGVRVRLNVFDHLNGHAIAARLIRDRVPGLAELALPPELAQIVELRDGLVLVCGPTGSGKSTTLAALIDLLDQRRAAHVVTLEDPIEVRFAARRCLIHQRELGTHIPTFAAGLRAALREAPDVILLGELRDRETLASALTAAETGHLVLATLHASSAASAIDRVIDAFPEGHQRQIRTQLAGALRAIVTQYLLPRKDGGRAPAIEYVPVTAAVSNIIRKGDLHTLPTAIQSGRDAGMIPLERSLAKLVESGAVSLQAVKRIAADHDLLASLSAKLR
jgi:twitching motility protein PilT